MKVAHRRLCKPLVLVQVPAKGELRVNGPAKLAEAAELDVVAEGAGLHRAPKVLLVGHLEPLVLKVLERRLDGALGVVGLERGEAHVRQAYRLVLLAKGHSQLEKKKEKVGKSIHMI